MEQYADHNEQQLNGKLNDVENTRELRIDSRPLDKNDTLDRSWSWVIMVASFGGYCLIGATMYVVGIIHTTLLAAFGASVSTTSWASAIHSALVSAGAPLTSYVIDHVSCRMAIILSGLLYSLGYFLTAFAPNIYVAIITNGIIAGFGAAMGFTSCMVVIGFNFKRYRNIASGFALSGVGIGMFFFAPLMQWARTFYGAKGFFIFLAGISANLVTFGALCFPSRLEITTHRKRKLDSSNNTQRKSKYFQAISVYKRVIVNKSILCLSLCNLMHNFGSFIVFMYLPSYVESKGFTPAQASYVVSITGIMTAIGRLLTGFLASSKHIPDILLYCGSLAIVSISTFMLPLISKYLVGNFAYSVFLGLTFSNCYVVTSSITIRYIGIQYMAAAVGVQLLFAGVGSLLGPIIAGLIIDAHGSYDLAFVMAASSKLLAAVLSACSTCFHHQNDAIVTEHSAKELELFVKEEPT